jgi:rubrerythrin
VVSANRRAFLRAAGVTGLGSSAVFLAACGGGGNAGAGTTPTSTTSDANADVDVLNNAIDLENTAIAIYAVGAKILQGDALTVGKLFLTQEEAHANSLSTAVGQLGGTPNQPQTDYSSAIGHPRTQADFLRLAVTIENTAISAYLNAIPKLTDPSLRQTVASILTSEAEHVSVLRTRLGLPAVPAAFVKGTA